MLNGFTKMRNIFGKQLSPVEPLLVYRALSLCYANGFTFPHERYQSNSLLEKHFSALVTRLCGIVF